MRLKISILSFVILTSPILLHASPCTDVTNQIYQDTQKYANTIQNQHLSWMSLPWLQKTLGATTAATMSNSKMEYEWQCPNNTDNTLTVLADKTGVISVEGKFSSAESAGLFSACLNSAECISPATPAATTPPTTPQAPASQVTPSDDLTCNDVLEQMHEIEPETGSTKSYPWQSLPWLKNHLGDPVIKHDSKGTSYGWSCSSSQAGTSVIIYHTMPDKSVVYQGVVCNKKGCDIDNIMRDKNNDKLINAFMHISMPGM